MTAILPKHPAAALALSCAAAIAATLAAPARAGVVAKQPTVAEAEVVRLAGAADVRVRTKYVGGAGGSAAPYYAKAVALGVADVTGRQITTVYMMKTNPGYETLRTELLGGKKIKFGDCLKVVPLTAKIADTIVVLDSAEPYALAPGEERPGVFIFREAAAKKVGQESATFVAAQKLGREYSFVVVPTVKSAQGRLEADKSLLAKLDGLKADDLIVIEPKGKYGQSIGMVGVSKYVPPERATFVQLRTESRNHVDYDVAVLKKAETELTMLVPKSVPGGAHAAKTGKAAPAASDQKILATLKELKKGAAVEFVAAPAEEADGVLASIAAAPPIAVNLMGNVAGPRPSAVGGSGGLDCIAYIAVAEFRAYVAGYEPMLGTGVATSRPIIGTVGTGSALVVIDAVMEVPR